MHHLTNRSTTIPETKEKECSKKQGKPEEIFKLKKKRPKIVEKFFLQSLKRLLRNEQ
jgi:hypothetical protein